MSQRTLGLGLAWMGALAALMAISAACSSDPEPTGAPASGGAGGGSGSGGTSTGGGGTSTGSAGTSAGASGEAGAASGATCAPGASCTVAVPSCLALVDNKGKATPGLRMSSITFKQPSAFAGLLGAALEEASTPALPTCNLTGKGTWSWLLQFDTAAGTLKTGGAKVPADPAAGYAFDDQVVSSDLEDFDSAPVTVEASPDASGAFATIPGVDLNLLVDIGGSPLVLPLRQATFTGTLSQDQSCIGAYNAAGLDPANSCLPDQDHPAFTNGGQVEGYISLETADSVVVSAASQTLCVLLGGDSDGAFPVARCERAGKIVAKGDWCSTTNKAADSSCADAVRVSLDYAASGVTIQ